MESDLARQEKVKADWLFLCSELEINKAKFDQLHYTEEQRRKAYMSYFNYQIPSGFHHQVMEAMDLSEIKNIKNYKNFLKACEEFDNVDYTLIVQDCENDLKKVCKKLSLN